MKTTKFQHTYPGGHTVHYVRLPSGSCYHQDTPVRLVRLLENLRREGTLVRVFYGDVKTGQSWHDEHDIIGRIGRSTGNIKIPLLVADGESGGCGLLDHCIIRIDSDEGTLYRHRTFRVGDLSLAQGLLKTHPWEVTIDGSVHARFKRNWDAIRYMAFLQGHIFSF